MSGLVLPIGDVAEIGDLKICSKNADHGKWLKCTDGRTVSRTTYALLFAEIGTIYGSGDGSTTFGLPSPEGRALGIAGNGSGLTSRSVNQKVGAETHTLSKNQVPPPTFQIPPSGTRGDVHNGATNHIASATTGSRGAISSGAIGTDYSSGAHNNMQPTYFAGNLFIYAGE